MNNKYQRINSQEELDELLSTLNGGPLDCFVQLNFGFRSSKSITVSDTSDYWVYNEIDDSEENIKHSQLMKSFIGEAISKGALYKY